MKFHKTDIIKMGGTALVTALVFVVFNLFSANGNTFYFAKSDRISWKDALKMQKEYVPNRQHLKTRVGSGDSVLRGIVFDARQLDEIINHNRHPTGTDSTADEVIFYLGKDGESGGWLSKYPNMHVIAAGMKGRYLLIDADQSTATKSSVFDKADPCPPNCPK